MDWALVALSLVLVLKRLDFFSVKSDGRNCESWGIFRDFVYVRVFGFLGIFSSSLFRGE